MKVDGQALLVGTGDEDVVGEVLDADNKRLAHRELMHPHVNEQPFTRALSGVVFPDGTREVYVRAKCSVDGWSGEVVKVELKP